ncbi:MAG: XdhC family protein [Lachnospiraceae bacterium]|nr:XdhC family protein [Lachnospiraceae bacterium]
MEVSRTKEFYEQVNELNPNYESVSLTVIEGDDIGEKALCSNRKLVWTSEEAGFFRSHADLVGGICESGMHVVDGRHVYAEILGHEKKLVICGGGHVSMPVISIGLMIGFSVTVLEDRPTFADNARRQGATHVICDSFENGLNQIESDKDTFYVIVTRGHRWDRDCLRIIAQKPHAYIGLMGSRRRVRIVMDALKEEGIDSEVLDRVHTPIGLNIGGETPEEIAVSILAEIIEVKNKEQRTFGYSKDMMKQILGAPHADQDARKKIMTTIVTRKGSAPRDVGTKMLILEDGTCIGTIGGGCVEAEVIAEGRRMLMKEQACPKVYHVDLTAEAAEDEGMVCGGIIDVLMEPIYS